jgi:flagellar biosynthesis/type III secretory pathway M-ring protein FliF/YscJ
MGLPKGRTNNVNGRPKGAKSKTSAELRDAIAEFVSNNIDNLQEKYDQLDAKEQLKFIEKLLQYAVPRLQSQNIEITDQQNQTFSYDDFLNRLIGTPHSSD